MTEITRSVEIAASREEVWSKIHPSNWTEIFEFVQEVNGYTDGKAGVGTQARVVAGSDISYNVEITEFREKDRIAYRRYGGPLAGKGVIKVKSLQSRTLFTRTGYYDDALSEQTVRALGEGMEKDNQRIKRLIESGK